MAVLRWLLMYFAKWFGRAGDRPQFSIVLLLRESREFNEDIVRMAAERAWGLKLASGSQGDNADAWISGDGERYSLHVDGYSLLVNYSDMPYIEPRRVQAFGDAPAVRQAIDEHTAWISLESPPGAEVPDDDVEEFIYLMSVLAGQFINQNCLAAYAPKAKQVIAWRENLNLRDADGGSEDRAEGD